MSMAQDLIEFEFQGKDFPYISFDIEEVHFQQAMVVQIYYYERNKLGKKFIRDGKPATNVKRFLIERFKVNSYYNRIIFVLKEI